MWNFIFYFILFPIQYPTAAYFTKSNSLRYSKPELYSKSFFFALINFYPQYSTKYFYAFIVLNFKPSPTNLFTYSQRTFYSCTFQVQFLQFLFAIIYNFNSSNRLFFPNSKYVCFIFLSYLTTKSNVHNRSFISILKHKLFASYFGLLFASLCNKKNSFLTKNIFIL